MIETQLPKTPTRQRGTSVSMDRVSRHYGPVKAVDDVSIRVEPGEFVSLLGPSGSGKTTLLMSIAGFERLDSGRILVGDRDITNLPTHKRDLGMVFQRYALFPHLSVADNIAYPLKTRGVPRAERLKAVADAMDLVGLQGKGNRRPSQLSGGQQQRVALARVLVYKPPIILFDEPLGALDRKLREEVQMEIRRLHKELGITMLFVTHDQEEALVMSDRVALLRDGKIEQFGVGTDLYNHPRTEFVAGFLGRTNLLRGETISTDSPGIWARLGDRKVFAATHPETEAMVPGELCRLALRPEAIRVIDTPTERSLSGTVREVVFSGPTITAHVNVDDQELIVQGLSTDPALRVLTGQNIHLTWDSDALRAFPVTADNK